MTTIAQLSARSGRLPATLTRVAKRLGFSKTGRDYHLSDSQAAELLAAVRNKPGCPLFGTEISGPQKKKRRRKRKARK